MNHLSKKKCTPCQGGIPPLGETEINPYLIRLANWQVIEQHHLLKSFTFPDFKSALAFVNQIGVLAEEENHHPNINFTWGKVEVSIWTHKIDGLHENDFILAAKIDRLL
ncbi:pterin-4-alpha-carbinolamine dehydratase [Ancylomarina subtilis]|uniref:Putative pterin-4-alpha-carbinolamine dehydratase n=1 Tax=Ancylomarina subtilis TaxID=1639035 RepID=A0A4Q7VH47_9BACT|nr:4a-hydroxytetrahydrobiopterin dehydratase [Ancylomarina subtilis]RZT95396.1 pterin-4-alpha-carbinolamine dehydratase [Ancylomarina subtilis]